jgi:Holliday junction resolvase
LTKDLSDVTIDEVWCTTAGWSGNSSYDGCDIVVTVSPYLCTSHEDSMYLIEAKKRQGEGGYRTSVFEGSKQEQSGLEELQEFTENTPEWARPILAIKFDHRKVVVLDARWLLSTLDELEYPVPSEVTDGILDVLSPRLTDSENVSMVKPPLSEWESSRAADDDAVVLARELGLPLEDDHP